MLKEQIEICLRDTPHFRFLNESKRLYGMQNQYKKPHTVKLRNADRTAMQCCTAYNGPGWLSYSIEQVRYHQDTVSRKN
jgi:hypothetical protein